MTGPPDSVLRRVQEIGWAEPVAPALTGATARGLLRAARIATWRAARTHGPVAVFFAGLVLLLWLPLGPKNGMPYETAFPYNSETTSFWNGFFYTADPLRIYTDVFYNLGYHLSAWIGLSGSFVGYQIVYAVLWWARGVLAYLIVRILVPKQLVFAVLIGVLVLVHASDHALNWVGQLNQFGMMFWTLLAFYALARALSAGTGWPATAATLFAMFFAYMSLWSYESALFMILAFPLIVLVVRYRFSRDTLAICAAFYVVPLVYMWDNYRRYTTSGSSTYQESVLRSSFAPGALLSDLWFNVVSSLKFTSWGSLMPPVLAETERTWLAVGGGALAAAGVGIAGLIALRRHDAIFPSTRGVLVTLAGGAILLVLSFPAYLILSSARLLWRTQFLSGIGAAATLAAVIGLLAVFVRRRVAQASIAAALAGVIAFYGVRASFTMASFHYSIWQRHRVAMSEVLGVAPRVSPGSLIVLTGVPKTADPFGDNMWFDLAVRLAYPHEQVTGVYFYSDGTPSPDENMALRGARWTFTGTGFGTLLRSVPVENTVVIRYSPSGHGALVEKIPSFIDKHDRLAAAARYFPSSRIEARAPSELALRRYGPVAIPSRPVAR